MRIYLTGFMMSGKSTLGKAVAEKLGIDFLDTDEMIEKETGFPVSEIFTLHGEPYFRKLEKEILMHTLSYPKALIATGGGMPCQADAMQWMNIHGVTVFLETDWNVLLPRLLEKNTDRPLLQDIHTETGRREIFALFQERNSCYQKSAITIEMMGDTEMDVLSLEKTCQYIW